jgi:predicted kinase
MGTLILMVGIPASGKTTMRNKFFPGARVISPDNFIGYTKQDPWTPQKAKIAWKKADEILLKAFKENDVLIFDATFVSPKRRKKYIRLAKRNDFEVIAIYCPVPVDTAIERNASREEFRQVPKFVINRMFFDLVPPSMEEGFDKVLTFDSVSNKLDSKLPKDLKLED